jgi:hypothetical protein
MKKRILFLFLTSLLLTFMASAQDLEQSRKVQERMERGQKTSAAINAIANMSPSLKALKEEGEVTQMIIEAGKTGDSALKPHLKVLAADEVVMRTRRGSGAFHAHIALAKLGDAEVLPEIFAELNSTIRWLKIRRLQNWRRLEGRRHFASCISCWMTTLIVTSNMMMN